MSLFRKIRDTFRKPDMPSAPTIRNKPGGLAWINSKVDMSDGAGALVNRIVRTVRLRHSDMWEIDPPQEYTITCPILHAASGRRFEPGDRAIAMGIRDECLTPIRDIGDDERDESHNWLPVNRPEQVT
jgi:hypothetical protein